MLSRQEGSTTRHLASAQYWAGLAGGNTGRLFLTFGGPVCADRISYCPLDRVLTYKNLIYLLNLQVCVHTSWHFLQIKKDRGKACAVILWPLLICTNDVLGAVTRALEMMAVLRKDFVLFVTGLRKPRRNACHTHI